MSGTMGVERGSGFATITLRELDTVDIMRE
jgi:hypothetical protein